MKKETASLIISINELHEARKTLEKQIANIDYIIDQLEKIVKEKAQATARVIPFDQIGLKRICAITGKPAKRIVYFARAY